MKVKEINKILSLKHLKQLNRLMKEHFQTDEINGKSILIISSELYHPFIEREVQGEVKIYRQGKEIKPLRPSVVRHPLVSSSLWTIDNLKKRKSFIPGVPFIFDSINDLKELEKILITWIEKEHQSEKILEIECFLEETPLKETINSQINYFFLGTFDYFPETLTFFEKDVVENYISKLQEIITEENIDNTDTFEEIDHYVNCKRIKYKTTESIKCLEVRKPNGRTLDRTFKEAILEHKKEIKFFALWPLLHMVVSLILYVFQTAITPITEKIEWLEVAINLPITKSFLTTIFIAQVINQDFLQNISHKPTKNEFQLVFWIITLFEAFIITLLIQINPYDSFGLTGAIIGAIIFTILGVVEWRKKKHYDL